MNRVAKFLAYDGKVSLVCTNTTELVEEIRNLHDLTPTTTAAMGRFATISGMMGFTDIKEKDDYITLQIKGDGPMGKLISVVKRDDVTSKVKVCVDNPHVELPLKSNGKLDVGGAIGKNGHEETRRYDDALGETVLMRSKETGNDYRYFPEPDIPYVVLTDAEIEKALETAPTISEMISQNKSLEDIAKIVTGDENILILAQELNMIYECDCNKEKFEKGLISIGKEELSKIINEDGKADTICHFCNKEYHFSKEELEDLLNEI